MKSFTVALLVLACSFGAHGLQVRSGPIPQVLSNACPSAQEVASSIIRVDGQDIMQQVFACPDGNFTTPEISAVREISSGLFDARSVVEARSASECTTPATECQCGQPTTCGCYSENSAPVSSDCSTLLASIPVISSIQGPTFIVQPSTVHTTSLRTCQISFINLAVTAEEYCLDELASNANSVMTCIQDPPFSDVVCMASSQRFEIHMGSTV